MKKNNLIPCLLLLILLAVGKSDFAQIKMEANGDVLVGRHFGQVPYRDFDVRGEMFVSHVPKNGVAGWNYVGCYFQNYTFTSGGSTVHRPIFEPQWGNNFWIGNAAKPFWQVHTNTLFATTVNTPSDERIKENFQPLENSLDRVLRLKPFYFDYIFTPTENMDEAMKNEVAASYKNHTGFKAQDLLKDFPKLVKLDKNVDRYSVNYIGLIPELTSAIQEQHKIITELKEELNIIKGNCCNTLPQAPNNETGTSDKLLPTLDQNNPNPFNQETTINYFLPVNTTSSTIFIYDMNGRQINKYNLTGHGKQSIKISKGKLPPGMYNYTLIVDGKEIATKRMILTD